MIGILEYSNYVGTAKKKLYASNNATKCYTKCSLFFLYILLYITKVKKGKVVYGQEPPSGESTTTECGFNYELLAVITEVAQWGAPSCSQPQPATDNGVIDGRSN